MESSLLKASTSSDSELIARLSYTTILISRYGILVLVILGTVGNSLNIIIFYQKKLRTSPCTLYLVVGACIDLVLTLAIALPRMLTTYNLDYSASIGFLCKMRHFTYFCLASLSVWMVALATFDRFLVSSPLATRRRMSSFRNAYRFIAGSSVLLVLIYGNLFYCAGVVGNGIITSCSSSTSKPCGFYNQIARLVTILCIPGMIILRCSIGIVRNLKYFKMNTTTISPHQSQQYRIRKTDKELIKLLIGQIVMLVISWLPLGIQRIYALITYDLQKSALRKTIEGLTDEITSTMSRFNNSLSFYVYLFVCGVLCRRTFTKWFQRTIRGRIVAPVNGIVMPVRVTAD